MSQESGHNSNPLETSAKFRSTPIAYFGILSMKSTKSKPCHWAMTCVGEVNLSTSVGDTF